MQEGDQQASPATPNLGGKPSRESLSRLLELSPLHISNAHSDPDPAIDSAKSTDISPFSFLVRPQYRYDTPAYSDFKSFVRISRTNSHPRQSSGSFSSTAAVQSSAFFMPIGPHIAGSFPTKDSPPPVNRSPNPGITYSPTSYERLPLKEWRFVKRALTEDIEPTLRLDIAPGLSWIARRSVQAAILEGTLIIEPTPASSIMLTYSCTLCGEKREGKEYGRTHRFCTGDNPSNQRHPLCQYCLERMRVTCDFVGFLRAVRDGIWKIDGEEGEEKAWDESVRLRERMFWARLGTQTWNPSTQNGKTQHDEERLSTETAGSGIDPLNKTVIGDPVTPELQVTKTFEQMALHNAEIENAENLRNEVKEDEPAGKESGEFVDALETGQDEVENKEDEKKDAPEEESEAQR
jgi:hypothetical protein